MKDIIRQIAINEVLYPTFELTKQYLQVNKILLNEGNPVIEDIIFSEDKDFAEVYFRIEDEDYFFVVIINLKPEPSLHFMNMSPGNYIYLIVSSETEDVDRLLKLVDIKPTQMWGINFKKDTLKKISELNLSIDIDLYASDPDLYEE